LTLALTVRAQTIALPNRATNAIGGSDFAARFELSSLQEREAAIRDAILGGNVPESFRRFRTVEVTNIVEGRTNHARFAVAPDYLAIGREGDCLLIPMTPVTAQRIADSLGCTLPTRKMVDAIYAAAAVKLSPVPIPPSPAMTTLPLFAQHNAIVSTQRAAFLQSHPPGALVAGHKKDMVISGRLTAPTNKVAIYGWHGPNGVPIQPLYTGHSAEWVDYSHGIRLVHQRMYVNGEAKRVADVLADPQLAGLISDEGVMSNLRYPTSFPASFGNRRSSPLWFEGFSPTGYPGEMARELRWPRDVRVLIHAPATNLFTTDRPVLLIFYALPNGNTIEQTIGKQLLPGDDWHFDIQHIGAQTRFLREVLTHQNVVVAYLENSLKSWPAWRRQHGDDFIPELLDTVKRIFAGSQMEVVLTGHSGGGSLTFGYLNRVTDIPADVRRIAFLDSNYAYETAKHADKLLRWLQASRDHRLCVLAYDDANALLDGKSFVSPEGGTWGRSHAMLDDFGPRFTFTSQTNNGLATHSALNGQIQFLLKENPDRKILHTVQVARNGFIHAMLSGTANEGMGYEYFGERAYQKWIRADSKEK
jgi:hypothetical protein